MAKHMVVIVTGGSGFIGAKLIEVLKKKNETVINIDVSVGRDLLNVDLVLRLCQEYKPSTIYHLAANKNARAKGEEMKALLETNVAGSASLLYAMYSGCMDSVKRFVFASTGGALFDVKKGEKAKLNDKPTPRGIYGFSKLVDEFMFSDFFDLYKEAGIEFSALRLANVYGWEIQNPKNVIAKWLELAYKNKTLEVYNTLEMYRDYIYVSDVVKAFIKAKPGIWHIGTGKAINLKEVLNTISKVMNKKVAYEITKSETANIEINYSALDPSAAEAWWRPEVSFEEGVKKTYKEMVAYLNRKETF